MKFVEKGCWVVVKIVEEELQVVVKIVEIQYQRLEFVEKRY